MALLKGNWCWRSALCLFEHQTKLTGQAFVARYGGGLQPACRGVDRPVGTVSPPFSGSGPDAGGRPPPRLLSTTSYAGWPPAAALREAAAAACKVPGQASAVRHFHTAWSAGDRVVPDTRARNALSMTSLDDFTKRQRPQREFEVIEFYSCGSAIEHMVARSPEELGLHPRDVSLFAADSRLFPQRATITARNGVIYFKTEAVKAIVHREKAIVFKSKRTKDNHAITDAILQAIESPSHAGSLPFELIMLEVLLHVTSFYFDRRISHLAWMIDTLLGDMAQSQERASEPFSAIDESVIRQLIPLEKFLTSVRNDVKEVVDEIDKVLHDDSLLAAICVSDATSSSGDGGGSGSVANNSSSGGSSSSSSGSISSSSTAAGGAPSHQAQAPAAPPAAAAPAPAVETPAMQQATLILETYERELQSIVGSLMEIQENLDNTRESWRMQLDSGRNHLMLINLYLSLLSISVVLVTLLPAFFGMNIDHGIPDTPSAFWSVVAISAFVGVASFPVGKYFYGRHWRTSSASQLRKLSHLRLFLLHHLDDLEAILDAVRSMKHTSITPADFHRSLGAQLPHLHISRSSSDVLYDQFDADKDGLLEGLELLKLRQSSSVLSEMSMNRH